MILVLGEPSDEPTVAVARALGRLDRRCVWLGQADLLGAELELIVAQGATGRLTTQTQEVVLDDVRALFLRMYEPETVVAIEEVDAERLSALVALNADMQAWANIANAFVVNRPRDAASNESKPHQLELIRRAGFCVPETLLTTDIDMARAFRHQHGRAIYKATSGIRSIVSYFDSDDVSIDNIVTCPVQLQAYVAGPDVRVHVVGDRVFACTIESDACDYRYTSQLVRITKCRLNDELSERCVRLAAQLRLPVAGIDLRRCEQGWVCFEVNPSPAFTSYACGTASEIADIAEAIARLLASA